MDLNILKLPLEFANQTNSFISKIKNDKKNRFYILYNADADGFVACYLLNKLLNQLGIYDIYFKPIWNFEYDFLFLYDLNLAEDTTILCVDLPIIQEPQILSKISIKHNFIIYDHHVIQDNYRIINNVFYVNSVFINKNYPSSLFSGLLLSSVTNLSVLDTILLLSGLQGDNFFETNQDFLEYSKSKYSFLFDKENLWEASIGKFTSYLNTFFRVNFTNSSKELFDFFNKLNNNSLSKEIISRFYNDFKIRDYSDIINTEVENEFTEINNCDYNSNLVCHLSNCQTFSVGIISTRLALNDINKIFAIGFRYKDKVQFELRTNRANNYKITDILKTQKKFFKPITSGGHPKASGALIYLKDLEFFKSTLSKSLS